MTNILVLDTETSGLPVTKGFNNYNDPSLTEFYNNSRVIELGYIVYGQDQREIFKRNFLVKPNGFVVTNSHIHNITTEMLNKDGINMLDILEIFECDLQGVGVFVAHNISFDYNVLLSECYRHNKQTLITKLKSLNQECTMKMGQKILNQKKFPSLQVLYAHFNSESNIPNNLKCHRALDDSIMCADCYFKIKTIQLTNSLDMSDAQKIAKN